LASKRGARAGARFQQLGREILDIAHKGLAARKRLNASGDDETGFLDPLREIVESGKVPAQRLLDRYNGEWNGDISRVYDEMSF
jgi:glutamate--cysteine ligase